MEFPNLLGWQGKVDRGPYIVVGLVGFAIKHNFDRLLATLVFHRQWGLFNYWIPLGRAIRVTALAPADRTFLMWMVACSLPFIWVGVVMTIQRLRAAWLPMWLVALFFAPYVNLLFFVFLSVYPSRDLKDLSVPSQEGRKRALARIIPQSNWGSAAMAVLISSVIGVLATLLSVSAFATYGWGLFVALPFCLGLVSVLLHGYHEERSFGNCMAVASLCIALVGLLLLALAIEGLICIMMAAPIGMALGLLGGFVGYLIQERRWHRIQMSATVGIVLLFIPLLMGMEGLGHREPPLLQVSTQIEINAPPETVWHFLVSFPTLPPPTEWPFRAGIAYPIQSNLHGSGLGAQRECRFSSGRFIEPIEVWEENRRLGFTISGEPLVMEEISPYGHIHTRHIDENYFRAQDAEFVLTPLANGHTLLTGTSRYRNQMWPSAYWRLWSDAIVHQIHLRVFRHVKHLSEAAAMQPGIR